MSEPKPCPFCGSDGVRWAAGGTYSYDRVHCDGCLTEFTFYPPAGDHRIGGPRMSDTLRRWNGRAPSGPDRCPFCGCEDVEFDGVMNHSAFFADAYCPGCRVRFEFQRSKLGKVPANNLRKAREAFGRRAEGV